jgi:phosphopantothenoylcysteine decarboxylase/phosphopantothenate--cysteine ligase
LDLFLSGTDVGAGSQSGKALAMPEEKSNLDGLNVLLGVSGGVAAYKAVDLASKLTCAGAKVNTVMTENACQLVGPKSFEAVTGSAVFSSLWTEPGQYRIAHINMVDWADVVVVAPATWALSL